MAEIALRRPNTSHHAMQRSLLIATVIVQLLAWTRLLPAADQGPVPQPTIKQIATEHPTYEKLTREPVAVNP